MAVVRALVKWFTLCVLKSSLVAKSLCADGIPPPHLPPAHQAADNHRGVLSTGIVQGTGSPLSSNLQCKWSRSADRAFSRQGIVEGIHEGVGALHGLVSLRRL